MALKEEQNPQDLLSIINKKDEALATRNEALLREEEISKGYRKRELLPEQKELTAEQIKDEKFRQYRPNYVNIEVQGEESEFWYGFDRSESLLNNVSLAFEAAAPVLANVFSDETPDEIYGEGFTDLDVEGRRKILLQYRKDQLIKEYPILSQVPQDEESFATAVGGLIGTLFDPTTLTPVGTGLKSLGAVSAVLSGSYNLADQYANKGEVDPAELAAMTAAGGVGGVAVGKGLQVVGNKIKVARAEKNTAEKMKNASETVDEINYITAKGVSQDLNQKQINAAIKSELGLSEDDVLKVLTKTDKRISYPTKEQAKGILEIGRKGTSEGSRVTNPLLDRLIGNVSTTLGKIDPRLKMLFRNFELNVHVMRNNSIKQFKPLIKLIKKVPKVERAALNTHLANGDFEAAKAILRKVSSEKADKALNKTLAELDNLFKIKTGKSVGFKIDKVANYFPRVVKDFDGLQDALGSNRIVQGVYDKALKDYAKSKGREVKNLSQKEREDIIAIVSQGKRSKFNGKDKPLSWSEDRKIPKLTQDLSKYYADATDALFRHANDSADAIQKRLLFKGSAVVDDTGNALDIAQSTTNYISKNLQNLNHKEQSIVQDIFNSRFNLGEQAPHKIVRTVRDLGYGTTLANPISAIVQIGDIGLSAFTQGLMPTVRAILGKKQISMKDLGLDNHIASEFSNSLDASKALHKVMTWGGFRHIDRFGKDVLLNAALRNGQKLAQSQKGIDKLAKTYKKAMGEGEFKQLVNELKDLKQGAKSQRIKEYLWSELSDVQPISLTEMPQQFLNMPNGRILWALKSYSIKQLDLIRNKIVKEFQQGNVSEGSKQLARYLALVPVIGGTIDETRDLALGRGFNAKDILPTSRETLMTNNSVEMLLKTFGGNKYVFDKTKKEGIASYAIETIKPPLGYINDLSLDINNIISKGGEESFRSVKNLPVGGKIWYNFFGDGLDKFKSYEAKEESKRTKEALNKYTPKKEKVPERRYTPDFSIRGFD
jgi:hypothetical protein